MVNNHDWLGKIGYIEMLQKVGTHFTINRMLSFDSVKLRLDREQPMTFLEFNYMILQGYDFRHLAQDNGRPPANGRVRPMGQHRQRHRTFAPNGCVGGLWPYHALLATADGSKDGQDL
jgi:hypothetical protein